MPEEKEITNSEKMKITLNYFNELELTPPTAVVNAIQDVFAENDTVHSVDFFFKDGIQDLQEEITLVNEVNLNLNGKSYGECNKVFTYYGQANISLSEFVRLYDGDELIEEITNIDHRDFPSQLVNPDDYLVMLIENTTFEKENSEPGKTEVKDTLRVYCPVNSEDE